MDEIKRERFGVSMPAHLVEAIDGHVATTSDASRSAYFQRLAEDDLRKAGKHPAEKDTIAIELAKAVAQHGPDRVATALRNLNEAAYAEEGA